ncbi:hypothetical protein PLCT1_02733 [Planctomycetaceae bacterium]|nr:hypothetical protein PLCT1_02733 [Planctomycetaceae bacterium]
MARDTHIYGEVNSKTGMTQIFRAIRHDVARARSRPALTELYRRAGYLITLTAAPAWQEKFGREASALRQVAKKEFATTARTINRRAGHIGAEGDYDEKWGDGR